MDWKQFQRDSGNLKPPICAEEQNPGSPPQSPTSASKSARIENPTCLSWLGAGILDFRSPRSALSKCNFFLKEKIENRFRAIFTMYLGYPKRAKRGVIAQFVKVNKFLENRFKPQIQLLTGLERRCGGSGAGIRNFAPPLGFQFFCARKLEALGYRKRSETASNRFS